MRQKLFPKIERNLSVFGENLKADRLRRKLSMEQVAETLTIRHHTFLTKRFDRSPKGERIHYSSAMTMLDCTDGADAAAGVSYLEIAEFLVRHGAAPDEDLRQLWKRIVFNMAVSNTNDHLRNHGFLLPPSGWRLSPAFDINPDPEGSGLSLNITENDNRLDANLALEAKEIIKKTKEITALWPAQADTCGTGSYEKELMSGAFNAL